jgi:hypothetical protein
LQGNFEPKVIKKNGVVATPQPSKQTVQTVFKEPITDRLEEIRSEVKTMVMV